MKNEVIENAVIYGDYFENNESSGLTLRLIGKTLAGIKATIHELEVDKYIHGMTCVDFLELLES